ncbi:Alkaline phosphatase synthesis sensor protein PhoR [compost metagenome]
MEGSQRLNAHITDLLEYSALISGTLRLHMSDINLAEVVRHVSHVMRARLRQHGLELTIEVEPGTPLVHGDYRRVSEMILKLLENAAKFTPAGGKVGVRIGHTDGRVRIDVWDTGPGIPEHEFARIWEAFTQLATSDTTRKGGLGLGLSLVKKLADLHGGRVGVVSQPGQGTTFTITLPASVPARPPGSVNTP